MANPNPNPDPYGPFEERSNETAWAPFIDTFEHKVSNMIKRRVRVRVRVRPSSTR